MRRLIVVGSLTGAPGVTTTALALAAAWPSEADGGVRPVVVEANVWGGDLVVRFGLPPAPGLLDVAASARQTHPGSLLGAVSELACGVRAVTAPAGRGPCTEAVRLLAAERGRHMLKGDDGDRGTVLLDVGRIDEVAGPLLAAADHIVLVARGDVEALAHVYAYGLEGDHRAGQLTLAVVGASPYPRDEITAALGMERAVFLPWDEKTVTAMVRCRRAMPRVSGFRASSLLAASRSLGLRLSGAGTLRYAGLAGVAGRSAIVPAVIGQAPAGLIEPQADGSGS
ncbi:hypothetical protein [Streptomyces sp. NPDC042319]|uniref:MinD/ParA family ATP-binding protein n=1 Tax=Streptomyces sp. NPDC042319 TaxID=3154332 RepID=UPI0033E794E1